MKKKNKILLVFGFPVGEHWLYKELKTKFPDREVEVVKNKNRVYDSRKSRLDVFKSAGHDNRAMFTGVVFFSP